jgi:flagellar biosynthesis chaperone FliJ
MRAFGKLTSFGALLALIAVPVVAAANLQAIEDWAKLRNYNPPSGVTQLATEDTMTSKAQHLFYINHPELIGDKTQFRQACPQSEQTIVLGCYHSEEAGIAIYNVSDARLNGVQEVTAAHEMLHAAYDRLSSSERSNVDNMLNDYYVNGLTDQRIKDTINAYKQTEPNDVVNEMHSVFGTEVTNLPAPLESYYRQYFTNRQAVIGFSNQYESVFTQNQSQLTNLKHQIDQLKAQLNTDKENIQEQESSLSSKNSRMQSLLSSGKTDEYNAEVSSYNSQVNGLRSLIASYNANVQKVNSLVDQYNQLAYTQESLYNSLDTRIQTQTTQ